VSDVPILVCGCGKRLRAPGAVPGRVGRCPSCGGTLRVPEPPEPAPSPVAAPVKTRKKKKKRPGQGQGSETAIWDGLIKPPARPERLLRESLLYPLWGATGVASLVILPPLLWLTSAPVVGGIEAVRTAQGTPLGLIGLFMLTAGSAGLFAVLGYTLLFLGKVLASSALGEVHNPRWPDWEISAIWFGLSRWLWAGLVGAVVGGVPAVFYWVNCGDIDLFDAMILSELLAAGAVYALMALLASVLHDDLLAANPLTVVGAIVRVGWGYAIPCLVCGAVVVATGTLLLASFAASNDVVSAFLFWLFWLSALYGAMVVLRVLGLFYWRNAKVLGWFRGRTGWGV
jgi:hypothetical protein